MKKTILAVMLSTLALTACHDDDDDDSPGNGGNPPPAQLQGVLTDGPISNVHYETSSGLSGETDAEGKFNYNEGDTIKFSIGNIQLGEAGGIPAQARITPADLYVDDETIEGNEDAATETALIVFLQSIDADRITPPDDAGEDYDPHDNGIQISQEMIDTINTAFTSETTFEAALEANGGDVEALLNQIDPDIDPIDPEEAEANIQESFYKEIAGTWQIGDDDNSDRVILIVYADGSYKLGEADEADDDGEPGYELGNLNWTWTSGAISPVIDDDGNGSWGLSDGADPESGVSYTLSYDGTNLILKETDNEGTENHTFTRVENPTTGLVGTWELDDTHTLVLLSDGYYFLIDTLDQEEECGPPGIEYGQYTNTDTTLTVTGNLFDTNEACGFNDGTTRLTAAPYTITGNQLTITPEGEDAATFTRATYGLVTESEPTP